MDNPNCSTEHKKYQHLTSEERHIIEVRFNEDKWSIYAIAKSLSRPYNTIKNEINRGTVYLYNGKIASCSFIPLKCISFNLLRRSLNNPGIQNILQLITSRINH